MVGYAHLHGTARLVAVGGICGLTAATAPQTGVLAALTACSVLALEADDIKGCAITVATIGLSALAALALAVLGYPYTLHEWLSGITEHAAVKFVHAEDTFGITLRAVLARYYQPGFLFWAIGGVSGLVIFMREKLGGRKAWAIKIGLVGVLLMYGSYACRGYLTYNSTPFIGPLIMGSLFALEKTAGSWRRILTVGFCLVCLYSAMRMIKQTVIPAMETDLTYFQARSQIAELKRRYPTMTISLGLMPALPEDRGVQIAPDRLFTDKDFKGAGEILLVQQTYSGQKAPPTYSSYRLLTSSFNANETARIGPFSFKMLPWGWNFAVYLNMSTPSRGNESTSGGGRKSHQKFGRSFRSAKPS